MAMTNADPGKTSSEINVTPLIDVLLVLLIIFMVILPVVPKGLGAMVPQPPRTDIEETPEAIVVSVLHTTKDGLAYRINSTDVAQRELLPRLVSIYANRAERVMFVKGDDDVSFAQIAEVIDMGHSAGANSVGLMTPKILAGQ
jgi:biopolymer transport protein TolR